MAAVTYTFTPNELIKSAEFNTNFNDLVTAINAINTGATTYGYRRANLSFISVTTVDIENNTDTANQTKVVFPDGEARSVTEDTSSTSKYRRFIITETANFITGTENSGLYTGLSETTNTWYAIYAVKSQINSSNFVLVGTTTIPTQGNASTLNTNLGTNSWVYLGLIRNGDNSAATGDILAFQQQSGLSVFDNTATGNAANQPGIRVASSASANAATYTYSSGTGATDLPAMIKVVHFAGSVPASAGSFSLGNSANTFTYSIGEASSGSTFRVLAGAASGLRVTKGGAAAALDVFIFGYVDSFL